MYTYTDRYAARTTDKRGRLRQLKFAATRTEAARAVFEADTRKDTCSTSIARRVNGELIDVHENIQFHRRRDIMGE